MIFLLDTNSCIQYLNGRSEKIKHHLESANPQEVRVCAVVKAELYYGVKKSRRSAQNLVTLSQFLNQFISLPFDDKAAEVYGEIRAALEVLGTPIGPNDLLIAAIAIANQATLVSHNTREFSRVSGLQLVDWEA